MRVIYSCYIMSNVNSLGNSLPAFENVYIINKWDKFQHLYLFFIFMSFLSVKETTNNICVITTIISQLQHLFELGPKCSANISERIQMTWIHNES